MLASCPVRASALRIGAGPALAAAALCFCALFFSGGFAVAPLVWIGGAAAPLAALLSGGAPLGPLPAAPARGPPGGLSLAPFSRALWVGGVAGAAPLPASCGGSP